MSRHRTRINTQLNQFISPLNLNWKTLCCVASWILNWKTLCDILNIFKETGCASNSPVSLFSYLHIYVNIYMWLFSLSIKPCTGAEDKCQSILLLLYCTHKTLTSVYIVFWLASVQKWNSCILSIHCHAVSYHVFISLHCNYILITILAFQLHLFFYWIWCSDTGRANQWCLGQTGLQSRLLVFNSYLPRAQIDKENKSYLLLGSITTKKSIYTFSFGMSACFVVWHNPLWLVIFTIFLCSHIHLTH